MPAPPVAAGAVPLLGHLHRLRRDRLGFLDGLRAQGPVVRIKLGPRPIWVVTEPAATREVLVVQAKWFDKGEGGRQLRPLVGDGLGTSEGETHRRQRLLMQPAFHRERIAAYAAAMRQQAEVTARGWQEGRPIDVRAEMYGLILGITSRALLSSALDADLHAEVRQGFPVALRAVQGRMFNPVKAVTGRLPTRHNRAEARLRARLHGVVDAAIARYRRSGERHPDLLSTLLTARDAETGATLSDRELRDQVMTMLFAGGETATSALAWSFHELARHPEIEVRLHAEVDEVLDGRPAEYADLPRLAFTGRVITEVLRHYPPAWIITRRAVTETELHGLRVPAGSAVLVSPYVLQHDPALFAQPWRFDPDRWLPERAAGVPKGAFIPFGAGTRKCIGDDFAVTETTLALATLAARWRLRPVPGPPVRPRPAMTLLPGNLRMCPERR
ncbi:cytochrome P450 [Amycolatopsis aidingensis]|uniref:cytochrome P450 n=1 Tax=Amycolatopsis aidingensis TaxID=2842453 RepID=UPI001C0AA7D1|nr:cytochrome P450 [Amycolatopsis aidingensis]